MSQSTPPNTSSETGPGPGDAEAAGPENESGIGLRALIDRLAEEFSVNADSLARVAAVFREVRDKAPDLFVPAAGALGPALDASDHAEPILSALGEWALDAEAEPIDRMRRDCQRFQTAMTRGLLRLYAGDAERCSEGLLALQRFNFLQIALLASLAARSQSEGGVVRTLPTPEYAAFMEIFRTTIEGHKQEGKQLGLLLIEIPKVEQVDRLLGLQRGEAFMLRVTRRMREGVLRKQDQLGRVSRNQLACLLPRIAGEGVAILAANKVLAALDAPVPIGDQSFAPDAAIGIAVFPEHGGDQQTLVRNGKLAVRAASIAAGHTAVYEPAHGESEELKMRHEARLRYALEQGTLELAFEPQLEVRSGRIGGLDCTLRWKDSELGPVTEAQAMATAEASGLVREVTWWMLNNAMRLGADIGRAGLQVPISVRITATGFHQPDFPEFMGRALRTWSLPPNRLVVELQEEALSGKADEVKESLVRLKAHGLRLGIDGFGTGASSLSHIARLPLDEIKLGAVFTADMKRNAAHAKIVRSLVGLGRELGLKVVAVGVSEAETALALSTLGVERLQGEYVSPPLGAQEIMAVASHLAGLTLRPGAGA